ncbi:MAG: hypothetical protein P2A85_29300 (plasmid) [Microcoleus anatoxicus]
MVESFGFIGMYLVVPELICGGWLSWWQFPRKRSGSIGGRMPVKIR